MARLSINSFLRPDRETPCLIPFAGTSSKTALVRLSANVLITERYVIHNVRYIKHNASAVGSARFLAAALRASLPLRDGRDLAFIIQ
jgi:hypothetical protein